MVLKGLIAPGPAAPGGEKIVDPCEAALARIANRPIVCHVLDRLLQAGVREVAIAVAAEVAHELRERVEAEGPRELHCDYLPYEAGGLAQALERAGALIEGAPCLVHPPDGLLGRPLDLLAQMLEGERLDLLAVVRHRAEQAEPIGLSTRRLLRLVGDEEQPSGTVLGPSGVCLFGPDRLRFALAGGWSSERETDCVALAERLVEDGGTLRFAYADDWLRCGGQVADLLELNRAVLERLVADRSPVPGSHNRVEGAVVVDPTASVQSSVIVGPAIIGPGALVVESYIGPYTSIGANARIEGAEVERSIILDGASIMHLGGRLVASVVGREARIARDFSLPRAMRLNVGDGGEVVLC